MPGRIPRARGRIVMKITKIEHFQLNRKAMSGSSTNTEKQKPVELPGSRPARSDEAKRSERRRVEKLEHEQMLERLGRRAEKFKIDADKYRRSLNYQRHGATERYYVKVINASTDKVVREVPPSEELDRIAAIMNFLREYFDVRG
jgi:uncharacterized FlaG/YvyC family protein